MNEQILNKNCEESIFKVDFSQQKLVAQTVKNLPAVLETQIRSLGWEDPLEEGMATTPAFLPGESHEKRSLVGYSPWCCTELNTTEATSHKTTQMGFRASAERLTEIQGCQEICPRKVLGGKNKPHTPNRVKKSLKGRSNG